MSFTLFNRDESLKNTTEIYTDAGKFDHIYYTRLYLYIFVILVVGLLIFFASGLYKHGLV
jgi:hypothetical protein